LTTNTTLTATGIVFYYSISNKQKNH